jgi:energy-coupling factor transporter ATP-binding protein EcfA2
MLAAVRSATLLGVEGRAVTVEVHVSNGLPGFQIVGLPDEACRESRDRVRAAVMSSGLPWPSNRVTVNLAPSSQRKGGSGLDLAIAIGLLVANGDIPGEAVERLGFLGELGLDGSLRAVAGVAPMVGAFQELTPVVPRASFREARAISPGPVRVALYLREIVDALTGVAPWPDEPDDDFVDDEPVVPDLSDVRGQATARMALEVAAAGGHHLLLVGPPGAGKTMLAQRMTGLLPSLTPAMALEATMVHSAAGVRLPAVGMRRTTAAPWCRWWVVEHRACDPARFRWRTGAYFSWTNSESSRRRCSTVCASPWRKGSSASPGLVPVRPCRRASCSSPPPTRVRAAAGRRGRAIATTVLACATSVASVVRCSTGST